MLMASMRFSAKPAKSAKATATAPHSAVRQLRQDERDEDVVRILGLGAGVGGHEGGLGLGADLATVLAGRDHGSLRARLPRGVVRGAGFEPPADSGLALRDRAGVLDL